MPRKKVLTHEDRFKLFNAEMSVRKKLRGYPEDILSKAIAYVWSSLDADIRENYQDRHGKKDHFEKMIIDRITEVQRKGKKAAEEEPATSKTAKDDDIENLLPEEPEEEEEEQPKKSKPAKIIEVANDDIPYAVHLQQSSALSSIATILRLLENGEKEPVETYNIIANLPQQEAGMTPAQYGEKLEQVGKDLLKRYVEKKASKATIGKTRTFAKRMKMLRAVKTSKK